MKILKYEENFINVSIVKKWSIDGKTIKYDGDKLGSFKNAKEVFEKILAFLVDDTKYLDLNEYEKEKKLSLGVFDNREGKFIE